MFLLVGPKYCYLTCEGTVGSLFMTPGLMKNMNFGSNYIWPLSCCMLFDLFWLICLCLKENYVNVNVNVMHFPLSNVNTVLCNVYFLSSPCHSIEKMKESSKPSTLIFNTLQDSSNCDPNLALLRAILARVPKDAGKRHGSLTSAPRWRELQIGVVVKAVIVRVS
jgi:hypothetical protein